MIAKFVCKRGALYNIYSEWRLPGGISVYMYGVKFSHDESSASPLAKIPNIKYRAGVNVYNVKKDKAFIDGYENTPEFHTVFDTTAAGCYNEMSLLSRCFNMDAVKNVRFIMSLFIFNVITSSDELFVSEEPSTKVTLFFLELCSLLADADFSQGVKPSTSDTTYYAESLRAYYLYTTGMAKLDADRGRPSRLATVL
tara:strand:+ start:212 stop:802 length:591 start_codon:yes stop_codon:yes gene_type:complete